MNPQVDLYLEVGCGRCPLGGTAACKVHTWPRELNLLRGLLLECGLTEERKWGIPCYTHDGRNIVILAAFKEYCALGFFKGVLLSDSERLLVSVGENSQSGMQLRFTSPEQVHAQAAAVRAYIYEAIEVERAGLKVAFRAKDELVYPEELLEAFATDPELEAAFEALTPGRKRGYILHFTQPKQTATRSARIQKNRDKILQGIDLQGR